jgi:ribosomal protein S20
MQVGTCVKGAKSFLDLGGCTAKFQACTTQAAADLAGQSNLLKNCRASANACLQGALTVSDIKACRTVFESCANDVQSTATDAVKEAIGAAKDAVDKATDVAVGVIQGASTVATGALDALSTCTKQADSCLAAVVSLNGISVCQASFEKCAGSAVALVDEVVKPLPIPTPTEIANTLAPCQSTAQACLKGAVTATDISACKGALQTCVKNVTSVADSTVDDVNKLLPPAIQLPTPTETVDCSTAATECLLKLGNPLDCAAQAAKCLGP